MNNIPMKSSSPISSTDLNNLNNTTGTAVESNNITNINLPKTQAYKQQNNQVGNTQYAGPANQVGNMSHAAATNQVGNMQHAAAAGQTAPVMPDNRFQLNQSQNGMSHSNQTNCSTEAKPLPQLKKPVQKGQKVILDESGKITKLKVCLGWNVKNPECDIDVSAFMLGKNSKVIGDEWFVFYGQTESPDKSLNFTPQDNIDRQYISIDFSKLNKDTAKIVFVLTINEAFAKHLNFSMVYDAYIRILDFNSGNELISFKMTDYYQNVISMMIGELYLHNGSWKFNAIGNGVAKDLNGLCGLYGVNVE